MRQKVKLKPKFKYWYKVNAKLYGGRVIYMECTVTLWKLFNDNHRKDLIENAIEAFKRECFISLSSQQIEIMNISRL